MFVEDYDMNVARQLVQGVDVWLNNPRRPQEASGTSGEKALLNGALNFSILDGWWAEAYDGTNGFAIGYGETHSVPSVQDDRDHAALIDTLINQVVPLYYNRDADGPASGLDRPPEERTPVAGLAVQRRPDGDGLRHELLPAGRWRSVVRDDQGVTPTAKQDTAGWGSAPAWLSSRECQVGDHAVDDHHREQVGTGLNTVEKGVTLCGFRTSGPLPHKGGGSNMSCRHMGLSLVQRYWD